MLRRAPKTVKGGDPRSLPCRGGEEEEFPLKKKKIGLPSSQSTEEEGHAAAQEERKAEALNYPSIRKAPPRADPNEKEGHDIAPTSSKKGGGGRGESQFKVVRTARKVKSPLSEGGSFLDPPRRRGSHLPEEGE